jgi:glycosyltransferase involved in cell wall biosynthesis
VLRVRRTLFELESLPRIALVTRRRAGYDGEGEAPLVSVVIATYNWSSVLRHSIRSALAQTYPRVEVVVVGDGCSDDSEAVASSFADPRVRWHNLPSNSGSQSAPNNAGIGLARGEYVAYLGHDDVWLPSHLSLVMAALARERADLGYAVTVQVGPPGSGYRELVGHSPSGRYVPGQPLKPSAIVHRRSLVETIGPWRDYRTIREMPDSEFVARARAAGVRFAGSGALTVFKFNSAHRRNSYVERPCHEQAAYLRRIEGERAFLLREYAALARDLTRALVVPRGRRLPELPPEPEDAPPGWGVTQLRRIRGLEP